MSTVSNLGIDKREGTAAIRISKMKKLNGRSYTEWINSRPKARRSDPSIQRKRKINDSEEEDDTADLVLKRVKEEKIDISNDFTQTKKRRNNISENQCDMDGPSTTKFVEYWVPVRLSNVQTELYCGSLFSNSGILCSSAKIYVIESLHKILDSIRKCCDHPYLVDPSLCGSLIQRIPGPEKLDAEIKLSSKLLLLHKILQEISKRGQRVVILYQALVGPEPISTGHILDDIIHEKFGEDSYVRLGEGLSKSKNREVLKSYNNKRSGKFICLMPTRACIPSLHLQSVDVVIFFNSDWDPMNDLRALQRIKLDSQLKHVKVFRLYSAFTLEEKLLMLAKQNASPEGNLMNMKRSTCNGLLTWGAYYLFQKLDEFHGSTTDGVISDADSFVDDVFLELSNLLPNSEDISVNSSSSFIVEAQQIGGLYSRDMCLLGEVEYPLMKNYSVVEKMMRKEPAYALWINLLEGRKPSWKYFSSQSPRTRKCVQRVDDEESVHASKKCRSEARMKSINEIRSPDKERLLPGEAASRTTRQAAMLDEQDLQTAHTTSNSRTNVTPLEASQLTQSQEFQRELERLQKQKTELSKQHEDKKLQYKLARDKVIDEINNKYETVLQDAETAFVEERQVLETAYKKVFAKKLLAEAAVLQRENSDRPQGKHMHLSSTNLKLSEVSPSIYLSSPDPMHNPLITFSENLQPRYQMTATAPHLRHMVHPLSSTPPPALLVSSYHPEITFCPVLLQPRAQSRL